jgi:hypothetical protein
MKKLWKKIISPTPEKWKRVRNLSGGLATAAGAGLLAVAGAGVTLDETLSKWIAGFIFIAGTIAGYSQTKEIPTK